MGTPILRSVPLEAIIDQGHELVGVVTQPDKVGKRSKISFPAVKETALKYNLPVYQPIKVKEPEFIETVRNLKPEVIVVAAFGQILPKELLDIPPMAVLMFMPPYFLNIVGQLQYKQPS